MRQRISNPKLKWWQGILAVLALIAALMAANLIGSAIAYMSNDETVYAIASVGYWIFGGAVAFGMVRAFIMDYLYTIEGLNFRIERIYGRMKPRMAENIITRSVVAFGTADEVGELYPGAHPRLYTRARCDIPVRALAYESGGSVKVVHIQPDEKLAAELEKILQDNLSK